MANEKSKKREMGEWHKVADETTAMNIRNCGCLVRTRTHNVSESLVYIPGQYIEEIFPDDDEGG